MHNFDLVKPFIFFINEESGFKSCVVSLTSNFLVTFRHGTHSCYVKDSTVLDVVSILSQKQYKATVFYICEEQDYVILKTDEKVAYRAAPIQQCDVMKKFVVCGFGKGFPELFMEQFIVCFHTFMNLMVDNLDHLSMELPKLQLVIQVTKFFIYIFFKLLFIFRSRLLWRKWINGPESWHNNYAKRIS